MIAGILLGHILYVLLEYHFYNVILILLNVLQRSFFNSKEVSCTFFGCRLEIVATLRA